MIAGWLYDLCVCLSGNAGPAVPVIEAMELAILDRRCRLISWGGAGLMVDPVSLFSFDPPYWRCYFSWLDKKRGLLTLILVYHFSHYISWIFTFRTFDIPRDASQCTVLVNPVIKQRSCNARFLSIAQKRKEPSVQFHKPESTFSTADCGWF